MTGGDWGPHLAVRETPDPRPGLVGPKAMDARGALHVPWKGGSQPLEPGKMWMSGENHGKSIYIYIYIYYIIYIYI